MEEHLRQRLLRRLESLPDDRVYQVLDYVEFLESKYAERSNPDNLFTRLGERVEDTMRAGKAPIRAISGTVSLFDGAAKVMRGLAAAAQSVVDESARVVSDVASPQLSDKKTDPAPDHTSPPSDSEPPR